MQIDACRIGNRIEEFSCQRGLEFAAALLFHIQIIGKIRSAAKIHRTQHQCIIHRQDKGSVTYHTGLITDRFLQRLSENDPGILHRMVTVHIQITFHAAFQIHKTMLCKSRKHMIKKADPRLHFGCSVTVKHQLHTDIRLFCLTRNLCFPHRIVPLYLLNRTPIELACAVSPSFFAKNIISSQSRRSASSE